jgi:small conductance mechanosensitive channel
MPEVWEFIRPYLVEYGGRLLGVLALVVVGWLAIRFLLSPVRRLLARSRLDPSLGSFLVNSARTLVVVAIVLASLHELGVETASLLTLLGAAVLAVALALQGSLTNFASGLVVLAYRLVRVGDVVETGDLRGRVVELLPFHIILVTADNLRVSVPNTTLINNPIRNHTALPTRRAEWTLPVPAAVDLVGAKEALLTHLRSDSRILGEPPPEVFVKEWSEDKRLLTVRAWTATADHLAVQQELLERLGAALQGMRPAEQGPL